MLLEYMNSTLVIAVMMFAVTVKMMYSLYLDYSFKVPFSETVVLNGQFFKVENRD